MILYIVQKEAVLSLELWNSTFSNLLLNAFINVKIIFIDKVLFRKFRLYNLRGLASIIVKTYVDRKVNKMWIRFQ